MFPLSLRAEVLHSLTATATPTGKKMEGGRGLLPPWHGRKVEFSSPDTRLWPVVPVYFVHSAVTRGVSKPPVFCIVIGVGRF